MGVIEDLLAKFDVQHAQSNIANVQRYKEGIGLHDENIAQFLPGGSFGAGMEAQLERAATKSVAQSQQSLVSSGLQGTTTAANIRKKWEEDVGTPARLQMEDIKAQKLAAARAEKAGFIERRQDIGPDYSTIASLAKTAATSAGGGSQTGFTVRSKSMLSPEARSKAVAHPSGGFFVPTGGGGGGYSRSSSPSYSGDSGYQAQLQAGYARSDADFRARQARERAAAEKRRQNLRTLWG